MHDIVTMFLGIGVTLNSIGLAKLAVTIRKQNNLINKVSDRAETALRDTERYKVFSRQCFNNFCYVKDGLKKIRKELIDKEILTQDFEYLSEEEATEVVVNDVLNKG